MSFTRGALTHQYFPAPVTTERTPGAVRVSLTRRNSNPWMPGIPMVWPIMRPSTAPNPNGAPFYINGYPDYRELLQRGGAQAVKMLRPNLEMDPTDPATWQREYRFT